MRTCSFCSAQLDRDDLSCTRCGAKYGLLYRGEIMAPSRINILVAVWGGLFVLGGIVAYLSKVTVIVLVGVGLMGLALWKVSGLAKSIRGGRRWWRRTVA